MSVNKVCTVNLLYTCTIAKHWLPTSIRSCHVYHTLSSASFILLPACVHRRSSHCVWWMMHCLFHYHAITPHHTVTFSTCYGTCYKNLYKIRGLSASEIRSFSVASPRISAKSCKGVCGIVKGLAEMGGTLCGSSTAIPRIAAQKLCGIRTEFPRISSAFVKFLVTSTIIAPTCGTCLLCTMATAQASSHQCCFYTDVKLGHCTFPQSWTVTITIWELLVSMNPTK